jgi:hypothetical protein
MALARLQGVLQAPQSDIVSRELSHPLTCCPSQLPKRKSHELIVQLPPEQVAVAWESEQGSPQEPQSGRVSREVSQPLASFPSQLSHRESQEPILQLPPLQVAVAWTRVQGVLQLPQSVSVSREVSQPSVSLVLQSPHMASQLPISQIPPLQASEAWSKAHASAQSLQLEMVPSCVSQPLVSFPSQSPKVLLHSH